MSDSVQASARPHPLRKRKRKKSPTGEMSLVEHLKELRRRVVISLLALIIGTIIGFIWYQNAPLGTMPLGEILRGPYCALPAENRADFTNDGECRLLATGPFEMFMLRLKVGALAGLVLSSPVWLYQVWGFITPGLHKTERRWTFTFVFLAVTLFVAGAVLAYFIVAYGLDFLLTIGDETQIAALTGERYYNFILALLLIFGVSFEVPLIIAMLNVAGALEYASIKDKRRFIIVGVFVFAAFITPGQDPFSMIVLALSVSLLVELAMQFCRWNDKRRDKARPDWMELDDEAASPLSTGPGGLDAPQPVEAPAPIRESPPRSGGAPAGGTGYFDDVL